MNNQTKTANPKVEKIEKVYTPDAKLWVPHDASEIAFASPAFSPNTYKEVGKEILSRNLNLPKAEYTASLLHAVYCGPEDFTNNPQISDVKSIMKNNWLWVANKNLWTKNGVYVVQDLDATGTNQDLDINELEEMLENGSEINRIRFSKDKKVRFAPVDTYKLGEHTHESFANDGFIIASCGQQGAKKLAEVSAKFEDKPYLYGVKTKTPEQRVSAVGEDDERLGFDGNDFGDSNRSHAFGVLDFCEADAKK